MHLSSKNTDTVSKNTILGDKTIYVSLRNLESRYVCVACLHLSWYVKASCSPTQTVLGTETTYLFLNSICSRLKKRFHYSESEWWTQHQWLSQLSTVTLLTGSCWCKSPRSSCLHPSSRSWSPAPGCLVWGDPGRQPSDTPMKNQHFFKSTFIIINFLAFVFYLQL